MNWLLGLHAACRVNFHRVTWNQFHSRPISQHKQTHRYIDHLASSFQVSSTPKHHQLLESLRAWSLGFEDNDRPRVIDASRILRASISWPRWFMTPSCSKKLEIKRIER